MDKKEIQDLELDNAQENYVPPPQKSVSEIIATDANDESLNRWVITWFENCAIFFSKTKRLIWEVVQNLIISRHCIPVQDDLSNMFVVEMIKKFWIEYRAA